MWLVDRTVVVVVPQEPFIDWLTKALPASEASELTESLEELQAAPTAYCLAEVEGPEDLERAIERHHKDIFEHELASWVDEDEAWPRKRDLATFLEFFQVYSTALTVDLVAASPKRENVDG